MDTENGRAEGHGPAGPRSTDRPDGALTSTATADLVRGSWAKLEGREEAVVERFYERLFQLDPEARDLFAATDMDHLRTKFADTVRMLLAAIDDSEGLSSLARRSGDRHAVYGVRDRDYRTGGEALLWALARELGEDFTPEVRAAWAEVYTRLAFAMSRSRPYQPR